MSIKNEHVAAITIAVNCYLQTEQHIQSQKPDSKKSKVMFHPLQYSPWVLAHRQAVMERSYQLQFRLYRK